MATWMQDASPAAEVTPDAAGSPHAPYVSEVVKRACRDAGLKRNDFSADAWNQLTATIAKAAEKSTLSKDDVSDMIYECDDALSKKGKGGGGKRAFGGVAGGVGGTIFGAFMIVGTPIAAAMGTAAGIDKMCDPEKHKVMNRVAKWIACPFASVVSVAAILPVAGACIYGGAKAGSTGGDLAHTAGNMWENAKHPLQFIKSLGQRLSAPDVPDDLDAAKTQQLAKALRIASERGARARGETPAAINLEEDPEVTEQQQPAVNAAERNKRKEAAAESDEKEAAAPKAANPAAKPVSAEEEALNEQILNAAQEKYRTAEQFAGQAKTGDDLVKAFHMLCDSMKTLESARATLAGASGDAREHAAGEARESGADDKTKAVMDAGQKAVAAVTGENEQLKRENADLQALLEELRQGAEKAKSLTTELAELKKQVAKLNESKNRTDQIGQNGEKNAKHAANENLDLDRPEIDAAVAALKNARIVVQDSPGDSMRSSARRKLQTAEEALAASKLVTGGRDFEIARVDIHEVAANTSRKLKTSAVGAERNN